FNLQVKLFLHFRISRVAQDTSVAQGAWAKFHAALKPPHNAPFTKFPGDIGSQALKFIETPGLSAVPFQNPRNFFVRKIRTEIQTLRGTRLAIDLPSVAIKDAPDSIGRTKRPSRVARSGLNPNVIENSRPKDLSVRDAVERDPSRHHHILATRQFTRRFRQPQ